MSKGHGVATTTAVSHSPLRGQVPTDSAIKGVSWGGHGEVLCPGYETAPAPERAVVAASDHDVVLIDGHAVDDRLLLLQRVIQERALQHIMCCSTFWPLIVQNTLPASGG